jgi:hypothetical protein
LRTRIRLIMDAAIAVAGLFILYAWDWPLEVIGAAGVSWTILDCITLLSLTGRPKK